MPKNFHGTPAMHTAAYQHHHKGQCTHNGLVHGWLPTIYTLVTHCKTLVKHCETLVKHCDIEVATANCGPKLVELLNAAPAEVYTHLLCLQCMSQTILFLQ